MKRKMMVVAVALAMAAVAVACTHQTCPAYRGSVAMAEVAE